MATDVVMPQMGESVAEGTITRWLVAVGDRVERDQPLFEISTDKVDAEIPSPADGVLLEIRQDEGATVEVDDVVALIGEEGEQPAAQAPAQAPAQATDQAGAEPHAQPATATEAKPEPKPEPEPAPQPEPQPEHQPEHQPEPTQAAQTETTSEAQPGAAHAGAPVAEAPADTDAAERLRTHSSPVVRKMAQEHGLDIIQIEGTGIHGRVTKADVEAYLAAQEGGDMAEEAPPAPERATAAQAPERATAAPAAEEPQEPGETEAAERKEEPSQVPQRRDVPAPSSRPTGDFYVAPYGPNDNVDIEPMSKIRQITAAHMTYSKATSAHVTTVFHVDMSRVAKIRKQAKENFQAAQGTKLTYMPFIFRAVANALKTHRKVNAAIDGSNIVFKRDINLGMAVALDWGLIVPVIKNADGLSLIGLAKSANDLADRARNKKLSPDEVQGGTFTITNPGVFGSLFGTPIINQPQVAILGLGTIEKRPVVVSDVEGNDTIAIKTMCYMAITYDHRLVDGADADHFMNDVKHTLATETWNELDPYV